MGSKRFDQKQMILFKASSQDMVQSVSTRKPVTIKQEETE